MVTMVSATERPDGGIIYRSEPAATPAFTPPVAHCEDICGDIRLAPSYPESPHIEANSYCPIVKHKSTATA